MNSMNEQLHALYTSWKGKLDRGEPVAAELSPPGLLKVTSSYENATRRVLVIGQEDMGNQWDQSILDDVTYDYGSARWEHEPVRTWSDFLSIDDSVDALMRGSDLFAFAAHQPRNFSSPFWRAFRRVTTDGLNGAATNLDRTSYNAGAIDDGPAHVRAFLDFAEKALSPDKNRNLIRNEISILKPTACIFFTGPNRDHLIDRKWLEIRRETVLDGVPAEQLCRLAHPDLPMHSYRTYHPGHLSRCNKGFYLDEIVRRLAATP